MLASYKVSEISYQVSEKGTKKMKKLLFFATIALIAISVQSVFAETIDLTNKGSGSASGVIGGTYIATWSPAQPTGTGYINPFLRVNVPGNSLPTEQGYNTDCPNATSCPLQDIAG